MLFIKIKNKIKLKLTKFSAYKNFANKEYFMYYSHSEFSQAAPTELVLRIWNKNEKNGVLSLLSTWSKDDRDWFFAF